MSIGAALERVISALEDAEIPYMLSGSIASSFYGVNRSTQDMDLIIDPGEAQLHVLIESLEKRSFYVSAWNAVSAFRRRFQFNVIDMDTSWKADLFIRKDRAFSVAEFSRRVQREVFGVRLWMSSLEDTILSKLEWAKRSGSERQLGDVEGMLKVQQAELDKAYLEKWARELGVSEKLAKALG